MDLEPLLCHLMTWQIWQLKSDLGLSCDHVLIYWDLSEDCKPFV